MVILVRSFPYPVALKCWPVSPVTAVWNVLRKPGGLSPIDVDSTTPQNKHGPATILTRGSDHSLYQPPSMRSERSRSHASLPIVDSPAIEES